MAKTSLPFYLRMANRMILTLLRAGLPMGKTILLTVRGRKSGQFYTNPVTIIERDGTRYLIAAYGLTHWVRNLRASGGGMLTRGRRHEAIAVTELPPAEAAPILMQGLATGPAMLRHYFDTTPSSSLDDYAREAVNHPVFRVSSAASAV